MGYFCRDAAIFFIGLLHSRWFWYILEDSYTFRNILESSDKSWKILERYILLYDHFPRYYLPKSIYTLWKKFEKEFFLFKNRNFCWENNNNSDRSFQNYEARSRKLVPPLYGETKEILIWTRKSCCNRTCCKSKQ